MAGYNPIDLSLTPLSAKTDAVCSSVTAYVSAEHGLTRDLESAVSLLVFDPKTDSWVGLEKVRADAASLGRLVVEKRGIRIGGELKIGKWTHPAEVFLYRASRSDERVGVTVKLHSYAYEAVFDFSPRDEGQFNEEAKHGLLGLCFGLATAAGADGWLLRFDAGELRPPEIQEILDVLRHPVLTIDGKRPGLLTGVRADLMPAPEMESIWKPGRHVYETIGGYCVLDLLWPLDVK
jgi:hypothetical protein